MTQYMPGRPTIYSQDLERMHKVHNTEIETMALRILELEVALQSQTEAFEKALERMESIFLSHYSC